MFARILIAGWALVFGFAFLLLFFPKILVRIPHLELFRPFFSPLGSSRSSTVSSAYTAKA